MNVTMCLLHTLSKWGSVHCRPVVYILLTRALKGEDNCPPLYRTDIPFIICTHSPAIEYGPRPLVR